MRTQAIQVRKERRTMNAITVQVDLQFTSHGTRDDYSLQTLVVLESCAWLRMRSKQRCLRGKSPRDMPRNEPADCLKTEGIRLQTHIDTFQSSQRIDDAVSRERIILNSEVGCHQGIQSPVSYTHLRAHETVLDLV